MGSGSIFHCKKCGEAYSFKIGVGFLYYMVKQDLLKDIKDGKYGKAYKTIVDENPDIDINGHRRIYKCPQCVHWEEKYDLTLSVKDKVIKKYSYKCPKCNVNMKVFHRKNWETFPCPYCGEENESFMNIFWD